MNTAQKIAVMQALVDGKAVEYRDRRVGFWTPFSSHDWDWKQCEYRVAQVEKLWFRNGLEKTCGILRVSVYTRVCRQDQLDRAHHVEAAEHFVRWLDDEWCLFPEEKEGVSK